MNRNAPDKVYINTNGGTTARLQRTRGFSPLSSSSFPQSSVSFSALDRHPHPRQFVPFVSIQPPCQSGQLTWTSQVWVMVRILVLRTKIFARLD